jgi:hypothetical protein
MSSLNLLLDYVSTKERGFTKSIWHKIKNNLKYWQGQCPCAELGYYAKFIIAGADACDSGSYAPVPYPRL